jgi:hypothetical protein
LKLLLIIKIINYYFFFLMVCQLVSALIFDLKLPQRTRRTFNQRVKRVDQIKT